LKAEYFLEAETTSTLLFREAKYTDNLYITHILPLSVFFFCEIFVRIVLIEEAERQSYLYSG